MQTPTIIRSDDMYLHLRDGNALRAVAPYTARQMGRAAIMPDLKLLVVGIADALAYKARIMTALPEGSAPTPLMTLYLTDQATPELVRGAKAAGIVAFKLYPAGTTTNSDSGVTDLFKLTPVLEEMAKQGILLLVHDGAADPKIDIFDCETVFIERVMKSVLARVPDLEVVFEYIITAEAVRLVLDAGDNAAASVAPQHLLLNRNGPLVGGVRPHHFCLPVFKRETHRRALVAVVTDEKTYKFFPGTDSVPHAKPAKENACGCAGMFSAMTAIELYAEVSEKAGALDKLKAFSLKSGTGSYGIPGDTDTITLAKQSQVVPVSVPYGDGEPIPMRTGGEIGWIAHY